MLHIPPNVIGEETTATRYLGSSWHTQYCPAYGEYEYVDSSGENLDRVLKSIDWAFDAGWGLLYLLFGLLAAWICFKRRSKYPVLSILMAVMAAAVLSLLGPGGGTCDYTVLQVRDVSLFWDNLVYLVVSGVMGILAVVLLAACLFAKREGSVANSALT